MRANKPDGHRRGRSACVFEEHACSRPRGRKKSKGGKGRAWRFYDLEKSWGLPSEPHIRATARAAALDAKHMRSVRQTAHISH